MDKILTREQYNKVAQVLDESLNDEDWDLFDKIEEQRYDWSSGDDFEFYDLTPDEVERIEAILAQT